MKTIQVTIIAGILMSAFCGVLGKVESNTIDGDNSVEDFSEELKKVREEFALSARDPKSYNHETAMLQQVARTLTGILPFGSTDSLKTLGDLLGLHAVNPNAVTIALKLLTIALPFIFLAVPKVTARISKGIESNTFAEMTSNLARNVLHSQHCIERISCEIGRGCHGNFLDRPVTRVIGQFHRLMPFPLRRFSGAYLDRHDCHKYHCGLLKNILRS